MADVITQVVDKSDKENECCICLLSDKNDCITLECNHYFCESCLREWFKRNRSCPLCRRKTSVLQEVKKQFFAQTVDYYSSTSSDDDYLNYNGFSSTSSDDDIVDYNSFSSISSNYNYNNYRPYSYGCYDFSSMSSNYNYNYRYYSYDNSSCLMHLVRLGMMDTFICNSEPVYTVFPIANKSLDPDVKSVMTGKILDEPDDNKTLNINTPSSMLQKIGRVPRNSQMGTIGLELTQCDIPYKKDDSDDITTGENK